MTYPGPVNGDRIEFEREHANMKPEDRPDWPMPSFDATDWAKAFCKIANESGFKDAKGQPIDEGWMIAWFANALMRGFDECDARLPHAAAGVLRRAHTILANMAAENEGFLNAAFGRRWPISHEPLRADARALLPELELMLGEVSP